MSKERELEISKKIDEKKGQITTIKEEISDLEKELLEERTGFKEGETVINEKGEKGILCCNKGYTFSWSWRKLKKDGTPSNAVTYIYGKFQRAE